MASTQYRVTQILFILCNILFLIMGVAMVVVGAYLQISRSNYVDLMPSDEFFTATALMISSGTIVVVVCLFGFIGVWMQSQCVMLIYLLCVLVILTLSVAAGIIAFVFHREFLARLYEVWRAILLSLASASFCIPTLVKVLMHFLFISIDVELKGKLLEGLKDKNKRDEWDDIQSSERCCGVSNYTDWYGVYDPDYPESLPDSCCDGPNCGSQGRVVAYDVGCYKKGKDWIKDNFYTLGAAGIVLGILQIISIAAALALLIMMRREKVV